MKKKIIVRINWLASKPLQMAGIARGTVTAMTGNTQFPTPKVALTAMTTAATRVENAWANRKNGAVAKDELSSSCNDLDVLLHTQGDYVSAIADGDETIIHSAGFEATGSTNSTARIAAPTGVEAPVLKPLAGGVIKVKAKPVANTSNYCFILAVDSAINATIVNGQLLMDNGSKVYVINSTKSTVVFNGLPTLKPVNVLFIASNANGDSGFSSVATGATLP